MKMSKFIFLVGAMLLLMASCESEIRTHEQIFTVEVTYTNGDVDTLVIPTKISPNSNSSYINHSDLILLTDDGTSCLWVAEYGHRRYAACGVRGFYILKTELKPIYNYE